MQLEGVTAKVSDWTKADAESQDSAGDDQLPLPETEGLWYMSQSKKHQVTILTTS
jgi:hypothetical protein